ncbi:prepilin peptidase [Microbacterium sp. E-13]|uniref:prepilin peptidase n=1 Tax=Microbacterium sp. E-13 TaxID=3404048 RepID=UPI003CEDA095
MVAGVFGLLIGSFINVVAYRVPAKISLMRESRCPQCDTAIKPWHNVPVLGWFALRGRCANCKAAISPRYPIVEAVTGLAFAAVTWWGLAVYDDLLNATLSAYLALPAVDGVVKPADVWALGVVVVAFLYLATVSILLALIDLDTKRLPNSIVLPSYVVAGVLFCVAALLSGEWDALLRAATGMVALYVFYALLRLARPGGMGGGDVKLAGVIGIYLGWLGWGALLVGAFAAFVYGGVFGIILILIRRAGRKTAIPFGPWMILGAWTGVFAGETISRWYVELFTGA